MLALILQICQEIFIYPLVNLYGLEGAAGCFLLLSTVRLIIWKIEIYKLINFSIRDMNLMILPVVACALPFFWVMPEWHHVGWILLLGVSGSTAHICLLRAMRYADASALAPIDFLRLVFAAIAAYFLIGDVSDFWTYIGASVIFLAAWYNTWRTHRIEKKSN